MGPLHSIHAHIEHTHNQCPAMMMRLLFGLCSGRARSISLSPPYVCSPTFISGRGHIVHSCLRIEIERGRRICVPTTRRSVCADKHANHARRKQQRWSQGNHLTLLCKSGNNPNSLVPKFTQHSSLQTERLHYFFLGIYLYKMPHDMSPSPERSYFEPGDELPFQV